MAIYVPRARRRRKLVLVGAAGMLLGLGLGVSFGRSSAPTVGERVRSVRSEARAVASGLRVVSLHEEEGTASLAASGDAGADLALRRVERDLRQLAGRAPWVSPRAVGDLLGQAASLRARPPGQARTADFGRSIDGLAGRIESVFGAAP